MSDPSRPAIGLLCTSTTEPWARRQWEGVVEAAADHNVELISFIGGVLHSERYDEEANIMYDLAALARLDGLIVWSEALGWLMPRDELEAFITRFRGKPMVSVERSFPGIPSVLMDEYEGMRAAVDHLIEAHGKRRIAFIRGPLTHQGMELRYRAYLDSLTAHGITADPVLVSEHALSDMNDATIIKALFDHCVQDMDAVVGADDLLALAALPILAERGLRVPEDVAVMGFDNMPECISSSPPLSSVIPPFIEMGHRSMRMILDQLAGLTVSETPVLPLDLILRSSCGCNRHFFSIEEQEPTNSAFKLHGEPITTIDEGYAEKGWARIERAILDSDWNLDTNPLRSHWDRFVSEVRGNEENSFLPTLIAALNNSADAGMDPTRWLRLLTKIQRVGAPWIAALPYRSRLMAGDLISRTNGFVAEAIQRQIAIRQVALESQHLIIRKLTEKLNGIHDVMEQMDAVARSLAQLNIAGCYLSLYKNSEDPCGEARLILAVDGGGRHELGPKGLVFPARELVPPSISGPTQRGLTRLVLALYVNKVRIGFVVFDIRNSDEASLCEILRWHLSGALKGAADIRAEKRTAAEKTHLLKELQHRVKNSLALIESITRIEINGAKSSEVRDSLSALEARIAAVSNLYEELYDTGSIQRVDLADYLGRVVESAVASVGLTTGRIVFERKLEHCALDMKRAVSLGLITNELVTDCLRHAFPNDRSGRVTVSLSTEEETIILCVQDDGVGLPPGFKLEESQGFGLQMVSLLSTQVGGTLLFDSAEPGTRVTLRLNAATMASPGDFDPD